MADPGASRREAEATALHAYLEAVGRLAAGVNDAAVHVTGQVAVAALVGAAAAAEAGLLRGAGAAGGTVQHDVAESQELTEEAGEDAVDAAVWGGRDRERVGGQDTETLKNMHER